jgi:hypothetical protein
MVGVLLSLGKCSAGEHQQAAVHLAASNDGPVDAFSVPVGGDQLLS